MFMDLPQGLKDKPGYKNKIFQLDQSLYGHRFAAKLFYDLLHKALTSKNGLGFKCSMNDHCLFIHDDTIIITWVDNTIIISKEPTTADKIIANLFTHGLDLKKEQGTGALENYLGVRFETNEQGKKVMLQQGLIN